MKQINESQFNSIAGKGANKENLDKILQLVESAKKENWNGATITFKEDLGVESLPYMSFTAPLRKLGLNVKAIDKNENTEKSHHYLGMAFTFKKAVAVKK